MNLSACPVCFSEDFQPVLKVSDRLVSRETFDIAECKNCSLRFTNPRPNNEDLGKYYESEDYISHTNEANTLVNKIYKLARHFTLASKRRLIQKNSSGKKLLDIGCGTGHFISHCDQKGWECTGVEPDKAAREIAVNENNLNVYPGIENITKQDYDRITLWHVLEHLPNLYDSLESISKLLKTDGKLFIAVPNYLAYEQKVFKEYWAAYDVPRHLYHFTREAIELLATKNGLKVEKIYPMWLDSFYISLLSNEHKYNRHKYLNSFITGLLSDIYAIKSRNFSSLIYQLSKIN